MSIRHTAPVESMACPACDGPANHPGECVDIDGNVFPAYEALALMWQSQGRRPLSFEEMTDLEPTLDEEEDRPAEPGGGYL